MITAAQIKQAARRYRKSAKLAEEHYDAFTELVREANTEGMGYDRLTQYSDLSKTQIQRILRG